MNKGKINFAIPIDRKSTTMFDERLCGKRIKLIHTDDPNSRLKEGDMGTVKCTFLNLNKVVINVQWDSGNNLGTIWVLSWEKMIIKYWNESSKSLNEVCSLLSE